MGAVFGFVSTGDRPLEQSHLAGMSRVLAHRGPEHEQLRYRNGMGLGFRSLQYEPFLKEALPTGGREGICHAFDGYLWNGGELAESVGDRLRADASLRELLTALYEKDGPDYGEALHGPYAGALLDPAGNKLVLSRNVSGQRTLFYVRTDAFFAFASEIKALLTLPGVSRDLDQESVYWYLASGYVPHPHTIYKHIRQLSAGCRLIYDLSRHDFQISDWDVRKGRVPIGKATEPDDYYISKLDDHLTRAVESQVARLSDPIGCFLTGGIDTSLVLAVLKKVTDRRIVTFTVGYDDPTCDETPYAKATADYLGVDHHGHMFTDRDFLEMTHRLCDVHDEPFSDLGAGTALMGSGVARRYVDATFTGAASDFLFGNYDLGYLYRYFQWTFPAMRKLMLAVIRKGYDSGVLAKKFPNMQQVAFMKGSSFFEAFFTKWKRDELASLLATTVDIKQGNLYQIFHQLNGLPLSDRIVKSVYPTYSVDCVDREFERSCMANSLHSVNPYLSADIFRFANQLPATLKWRKGYGKYVNRQLLRRYLPLELFKRPKRGTSLPFVGQTNGAMDQLIDEYLTPERLKKEELFQDTTPILDAISAYRAGQHILGHKLWTLAVFQIWRERSA